MNPTANIVVIVGLGNPGSEYATTRHNIGFMVADALVHRIRGSWVSAGRDLEVAEQRLGECQVFVCKPLSYMNRSGDVVAPYLRAKGIAPSQVVVVTDEYNFPTGRIHLRPGGSAGGHNGVASMIEHLGSPDFWRLRCGIGRDFGPGELVDYVLSPFPASESEALASMIDKAVKAVEQMARVGTDRAMQEINRAG